MGGWLAANRKTLRYDRRIVMILVHQVVNVERRTIGG
jgi:hypothetical protein